MNRVLLFDIDGTLVHADGAGRRALEKALVFHCGELNSATARIRYGGMTDRLIVREVMNALQQPFDEAQCDRILQSYVEQLVEEIESPNYRIFPGVVELLEVLSRAGAPYGLCTGNVIGGARLKLERGGLDRFFDWSESGMNGFAEDGEARVRIVEAALRRAARRLGRTVAPEEALIIGDTPRDIEAAQAAGGVPVLGVATGGFSAQELLRCGATRVVETLAEPGLVDWLLA